MISTVQKTDNIEVNTAGTNLNKNEDDWLTNVPDDLKPFCRKVYEGFFEPLDFTALSGDKPGWIDEKKVQKGQKFAKKHLFSLVLISLVSLVIIFAENLVKKSFIYFGKANTPFKMLRRQLRIGNDITSFYENDLYGSEQDSPKKKLEIVLKIHKNIHERLASLTSEQIDEKILSYKTHDLYGMFNSYELIADDYFKNSCDDFKLCSKFNDRSTNVLLSQSNFMLVQLTFMGLALSNSKYFGIYWTNEEEWDGFVHIWRIIGHLLGISDEYNICNADLETVRRRVEVLIDFWLKPALAGVDVSWEFMTRCTVDGARLFAPFPMLNFESVLLFLSSSLGVKLSKFQKATNLGNYLLYLLMKFLAFCQIIPGIPALSNYIIQKLLKRGKNACPEMLQKWRERNFFYIFQGFDKI